MASTGRKRAPRAVPPGGPGDAPRRKRGTARVEPARSDLALLIHAGEELTRSLDLPEVLATISRSLMEVVPAWRIGILLREGPDRLRLAAAVVRGEERVQGPQPMLDISRYPEIETAMRSRETVVVDDVTTSVLMAGARHPLTTTGVRRLLVIPLLIQDQCLGVLSVAQQSGDRACTPRERALIQAVANQAAVGLRNAQLFAELQASARQLEQKVEDRTRRLRESHLRLSVLNDIMTAIHMSLDEERIIEAALGGLERLENVDRAQVYLLAGGGRGGRNPSGMPEEIDAWQLRAGGHLERARRPLEGPDAAAELGALAGKPILFGAGSPEPRSHLLAPLVSKAGVIGALQVISAQPEAHGDADHELLQQVAGEISIALERSALYAAEQRRSLQFELISDIGRRITEAAVLENFLQRAAELIRESFGYSLACILTIDRRAGVLAVAGASGADPAVAARVARHSQDPGGGLCGRALRELGAVNVPDVRVEPEFIAVEGISTLSELVVPIVMAGRALGVVDLQSDRAGAFDQTDVAVVRTLADQLAAAIHLSEVISELQRGRHFHEQVADNLTAGLIVTDRKRVVLVVNPRAAETLHVSREELLGRDLLSVLPTAAPMFQFSYEAVGRDCEVVLRDGARIPLGFSNAFFVDAPEEQDGVIITFKDLSEVRELKRELRHRERLATMGTVVAGVAHEIRNPLTGISATAQILARDLPPSSPLAELCRGMVDETRRLNDMVTMLVAYGRPQELKLRVVEPCALLEDVVRSARARAEAAGVTVATGCASDGRTLKADPDQLRQVVLNLLLNAFEAAPGGRVTASVDWDAAAGDIVLSVRDDGSGLSPAQIDKVFDLFYTTKPGGSGLGLAISSRIVQDHGGSISASSPKGGGALFQVRLPLRRVERETSGARR